MLFCDSQEWFDRGIIKSTSIVLKEKWNNLAKIVLRAGFEPAT